MDREMISDALNEIRDDYLLEAAQSYPAGGPGKERHMKVSVRKILRTVLIAAALAGVFGATAYAAGWIGTKAIVIEDGRPVYDYERTEDGTWQETEYPNGAHFSLTQPQEIPEGLDCAAAEKLKANSAAWAEWTAYRAARPTPQYPAVFDQPEDGPFTEEIRNEDGSGTLRFYSKAPEMGADGQPAYDPESLVEERTVTAEDYSALEAYGEAMDANMRFENEGKYDFNYGCWNAGDEAKLEEIAAQYGLSLRGGSTILWSWETVKESRDRYDAEHGTVSPPLDFSGPQWLSNAELTARIAKECCHGDFFYETPVGFDKFYYFDEGTFCVSWYYELPSGERVTCYGYNSVYSTLSSGYEVTDMAEDLSAFSERSHIAPDGTEICILRSGDAAYLYVYLDRSFFCEHVAGASNMSDADLDAIADAICYSNIGK